MGIMDFTTGGQIAKLLTPKVDKPLDTNFFEIDIDKTLQMGEDFDRLNLFMGQQQREKELPGMMAAKQADQQKLFEDLSRVDPVEQAGYVNEGLQQSLSAFGGGGMGANAIEGAGRSGIASNVKNRTLEHQDMARANYMDAMSDNPEVGIGGTGQDRANLALYNSKNYNLARNQQKQSNWEYEAAKKQAKTQGWSSALGML